ncbi:MAG: tetratricopeptide repeat protein [Desulfovibrio sp.]
MNKKNLIIVGLFIIFALQGCTAIMGPYYLEQDRYSEGVSALSEKIAEDPQDASSQYYLGRCYLGLDDADKALVHMKKAVALAPEKADYWFWLGVNYWALRDFAAEQKSYEKAISVDSRHISANLYLAHSSFDKGQWEKALKLYDTVLKLDQYNPEALYNRSLVLGELGDSIGETENLKKFLRYYPDGSMAMKAANILNSKGDFSYRNYIVGARTVTLKEIAFKKDQAVLELESKDSLYFLAAMLEKNKKLDLHVVVYVAGNEQLARQRAKVIKDTVYSGHAHFSNSRLRLSWFGVPENVTRAGIVHEVKESVQLVTVIK